MSNELDLMPPLDDNNDDLTALLQDRAPRPRSQVTTALWVVLILLVGVLVGVSIGKASGTAATPAPGGFPIPGQGAAESSTAGSTPGQLPGMQQGQPPAGFPGRGTSGTVVSQDGSILTVETDTGTVTVNTSDSTQVTKSEQIGVQALEPGETVTIVGEEAADGTIDAERIIAGDGAGFGPGMPGRP